ncbi:hypothetical protein RR46_12794 [Papilio xuthus]|uniref:Uncharacterized protein n=1 Tax=Papilio xuthus TaxID=66420 RepID=A0A194PLM1_PAPXU|nr:hypothetical protein RR46_12794 [Papilio xuthus]
MTACDWTSPSPGPSRAMSGLTRVPARVISYRRATTRRLPPAAGTYAHLAINNTLI